MSLNNFVSPPKFEDYKERFKDFYNMERRADGVILVQAHSKGGPIAAAFAQWLEDIALQWDPDRKAKLQVYTFAGPTPGNAGFAHRYKSSGIAAYRSWNVG